MYTLIMVIHISVCLILVGVVLLQAGKGAEMGAAFGGSSQTIFGSRGSATFLSKLTVGAAVIFMVTSLSLSILSRERSAVSSVINLDQKTSSDQETSSSDEIPTPVETPDEAAEKADSE